MEKFIQAPAKHPQDLKRVPMANPGMCCFHQAWLPDLFHKFPCVMGANAASNMGWGFVNPAEVADQHLYTRPWNGIDARTGSCADYGIWPKAALSANAHKMITIAASPASSGPANADAARNSKKNLPARLWLNPALHSSANPEENTPDLEALAAPAAVHPRFLLRERWCERNAGLFSICQLTSI